MENRWLNGKERARNKTNGAFVTCKSAIKEHLYIYFTNTDMLYINYKYIYIYIYTYIQFYLKIKEKTMNGVDWEIDKMCGFSIKASTKAERTIL